MLNLNKNKRIQLCNLSRINTKDTTTEKKNLIHKRKKSNEKIIKLWYLTSLALVVVSPPLMIRKLTFWSYQNIKLHFCHPDTITHHSCQKFDANCWPLQLLLIRWPYFWFYVVFHLSLCTLLCLAFPLSILPLFTGVALLRTRIIIRLTTSTFQMMLLSQVWLLCKVFGSSVWVAHNMDVRQIGYVVLVLWQFCCLTFTPQLTSQLSDFFAPLGVFQKPTSVLFCSQEIKKEKKKNIYEKVKRKILSC